MADPLGIHRRRPQWRSWLVEPQPTVFRELQQNTRLEPGTVCLPFALSPEAGTLQLHRVKDSFRFTPHGAAHNFSGHASSNREKLLQEIAIITGQSTVSDDWLETVEVPCITWDELFDRHVEGIPDVLLIDTEGMDAALLKAFPWSRSDARPRIIIFEHLWMNPAEYRNTNDTLRRANYLLLPHTIDTIAIHQDVLDQRFANPIPLANYDINSKLSD
ncbi:MAG: FkbM family methyltransferase [Candidatus Synoicihabitans palmerolidicus]|nr:FkbM family methyltransferase [Candidatus Synoicihabitans palmerolidicus]MCC5025382.1 FkbM family methyltransferase [Candidatus Synoicihabitans palmerolidicus]